jgi:hypothetical protein
MPVFSTKEEFEQFYKQGKEIWQAEINNRTAKKEEEEIMSFLQSHLNLIKTMDFQKEMSESFGSSLGKGILVVATGVNLPSSDYKKLNQERATILRSINGVKDKSCYPKVVEFVIENNKGLNKEWTNNGQFFESKSDFYDAFISQKYKQILNDKKKK